MEFQDWQAQMMPVSGQGRGDHRQAAPRARSARSQLSVRGPVHALRQSGARIPACRSGTSEQATVLASACGSALAPAAEVPSPPPRRASSRSTSRRSRQLARAGRSRRAGRMRRRHQGRRLRSRRGARQPALWPAGCRTFFVATPDEAATARQVRRAPPSTCSTAWSRARRRI